MPVRLLNQDLLFHRWCVRVVFHILTQYLYKRTELEAKKGIENGVQACSEAWIEAHIWLHICEAFTRVSVTCPPYFHSSTALLLKGVLRYCDPM